MGLKSGMSGVSKSLRGDIKSLIKSVKKQLKIKSPSRVFRDEVGKNMALGLGVGFNSTMKDVTGQMQGSIPTNFDLNPSLARSVSSQNGLNTYGNMVNAFKQALSEVTVELNDYEMGKFVNKTVARTIYT